MTRVIGVGGVFLRAKHYETLREWYRVHLGIDAGDWGKTFRSDDPENGGAPSTTVWTLFKPESTYFPGPLMINYRVADLDALVAALRAEGCNVDENVQDTEFGKFGWVTDPEGNRIELWQPPQPNP